MRCAGLAEPETNAQLIHGTFLSFFSFERQKDAAAYFFDS